MKTILLLFVIMFGENLFAQEWKYITKSTDGTEYYYKPNTTKTAWVKQVSSKTSYYSKSEKGQKKIVDGYHICLWKFDCEEKKLGLAQQNTYDINGEMLNAVTLKDYDIEMIYPVPDSIAENLINTFCSN
jgi:hypothetical protein